VPIPWLITSLVLVALAIVILLRQKHSRVARLFCLMITLVAIWFGGFAAMLATSNESTAFLFAKIGLAAVAVLPAAIYDFTATALRLTIRRGAIVATLWVIAIAFAVLMVDGRSMLSGVARYPWGFYPIAGPLLSAFLVFFFGVLLAQLGEYALEYRRTGDDERRARLRGGEPHAPARERVARDLERDVRSVVRAREVHQHDVARREREPAEERVRLLVREVAAR